MKILHVYKDYSPVLGGIEHYVQTLAEAQARAGHEVTVLVCARGAVGSTREERGVRVSRAGRLATLASMPISPALVWRLRAERPDIVHLHLPFPLGEAAQLLFGRCRTWVATHHADVTRQRRLLLVYAPVLRRILAGARRVVALSPRLVESSPWLAPHRAKCVVIPFGVDLERFHPADVTNKANETFEQVDQSGQSATAASIKSSALSSPVEPDAFLFVGRHRHYKDMPLLLTALARVPEARLTVAGDGPMREAWEARARALGLGQRARFIGEVADEDLPELYRSARALVLPAASRAEAFGIVLLEAMASGLPCLTTEVGTGTSWVVEHGRTGFVTPVGDVEAMVSAMRQLIDNPETAQNMGRRARERAKALFGPERMFEAMAALYADALPDALPDALADALADARTAAQTDAAQADALVDDARRKR